MTRKHLLLVQMFNVKSLVDQPLIEDLDRLVQLDKLLDWYEGFNPLLPLRELAEYQLKQRVEAAALQHFTDSEFKSFRHHWRKLSEQERRQFLCELTGVSAPHSDRGFDI